MQYWEDIAEILDRDAERDEALRERTERDWARYERLMREEQLAHNDYRLVDEGGGE